MKLTPAPWSAPESASSFGLDRRRGGLYRRYTLYLTLLLSLALIVSGGIGAYLAYQDARALVDELQREKARSAAARIEQFVRTVELQMKGAVVSGRTGGTPDLGARHIELLRLLRIAPSISDAASLDASGHERVRVSRVSRDVVGSDIDRSNDPAFAAVRDGMTWYGGISFRKGSEPYLEMAISGNRPDDGAVIADINLKFATDVVAGIRIGETGKAYVVDARGGLIVDPDPGMALRMTNLADVPAVRAALAQPKSTGDAQPTVIASIDGGPRTIAAHATIEPLGWHVIVEQPLREAFAPMFASLVRTVFLFLVSIVLAAVASLLLARRMTSPISALQHGVRRIGEGHLDERVEIHTGDELEALADQFNRMAQKLRESYAGLEQKVAQRTRQLEEANRAKARFLAAASHDLRQPVHALGLFVAQLEGARDDGARRQLIGKVAASSAAVSGLIEALLDISKLDAGAVAPQSTEFALQPLFDRVEHALAPTAQAKGLRLRMRPTVLWVTTDPMLLERILQNLCTNAIRYSEQGGAILAARMRGHDVSIEVWDTGVGITAEQQRHIFEEFYQAASTSEGGSKGLGLGLAIVDRLARLLDLTISVRSVPSRGSVFTIAVPRMRAPQQGESPHSQLLAPARFEALSVLLIDDDPVARDAIEGLLVQWGCDVRSAACGADALKLVTGTAAPRVIISDYHLGDGALGTAVVAQVRDVLHGDTPAVILTADVSVELREATATAGVYLLHKPLNAARLRALLLHVAGNR
jgi:signal transduction histidine kinase/CheY-like chemotaxis protein